MDNVRMEARAGEQRPTPTACTGPREANAISREWPLPAMLRRSGLSAHTLPSLVPRQKFLCGSAKEWTAAVADCIAEQAPAAYRSLCRMERDVGDLRTRFQRTRRSRLAEAAELRVALPSLTRNKLAIAVNVTPAGAGYLMRQLER